MSKLKKFLLLIPTAFIMLLNCMSFTAFAEDTTEAPTEAPTEIDYQSYYLDPEETIPEVLAALDFRNLENFPTLEIPEKYAYSVTCTIENYNNYINGTSETLGLIIDLYDLTDAEYKSNDYYMVTTKRILFKHAVYSFDATGSDDNISFFNNTSFAFYCPATEYLETNYSSNNLHDRLLYSTTKYRFYFETNVEEFGYSSSALDVEVAFKPTLSGVVDRSFTRDGVEYLSTNFSLHVNNKSKFPIQYTMDIRPVDSYTDFVFRYYENDWVYAPKLDSAGDFWNQVPQKQQKSTNCHYVSSGSLDSVVFNYNQVNLVEGIEYVVEVYAARNDYGCASELVVSSVEEVYPELYQVQNTLVYQSQFSMKQYSDVKYDPTNTSNGVLPYDFELGQKYEHSYNAVEKEDGEVDYTGKDVYSDKDSWYHKPIDDNSHISVSSKKNTISSDLNLLSNNFSSFFRFINKVFGYFPKNYQSIISLGLLSIVVLGIIKLVIK